MKFFNTVPLLFCFIVIVTLGFSTPARASAPFSDSFDAYTSNSLYSQGLWQNNSHTWQGTDQNCYQNTGRCIVSTGIDGSNWKSGTELPTGEWRIRFYVSSDFGRADLVPYISFGSAERLQSSLTIVTDTPGSTVIHDGGGNVVSTELVNQQWHSLVYKWNMSDPINCSFSISIDGAPDHQTSPSGGSPADCYNGVYSSHTISTLGFSTYYVGVGQVYFDDVGDGPIVDGCMTNCTGKTKSQISDTFDLYNFEGWQTFPAPFGMLTLFGAESADSGNCHLGNCLISNGAIGGLGTVGSTPIMYLESGVGASSGAYTLWARTRIGYRFAQANFGLCVGLWSGCRGRDVYMFEDFAAPDNMWHQYYFAWRQGVTSIEVCKLKDDTNQSHCSWVATNLAAGSQFDGVLLTSNTYRSDIGDAVWFDDLSEAATTTPGPTVCTKDCYSNVLFLPGIEGSRLYKDDGNGGDTQLWEPLSDSLSKQLSLDINGNSVNAIYTKEGALLDNVYVPFFGNVYKTFISTMNDMKANGTIVDWQPIAYDWRLAINQIVNSGTKTNANISYLQPNDSPYILQELKRLAASSKTGKVTLITHSNGGLVAKALMLKLGPDASKYIDKVVMVAVPQLGTPETIATMLHGTDSAFPFNHLSEAAARDIMQNMPGAYGLVPSNAYMGSVATPVIRFDSSVPTWVSKYGTSVNSADQLRTFMTDTTRIKPVYEDLQTPQVANSNLYDAALVAHIVLDTWTPPSDIQLITIAGWGNDTLAGITYKTVVTNTCVQKNILGFCTSSKKGTELTFDPTMVIDGDGTVVTPSALWSNGATSTKYWMNLKKYNSEHKPSTLLGRFLFEHRNILETTSAVELLSKIVKNTVDMSSVNYISSTSPTSSGSRLNFTLHSPLTLGFKDTLGNYSGSTATTTILNDTDIEYRHYGDVQWLSIPADSTGSIILQGTASGSFTLDVAQVVNGYPVSTTAFEGIPSATSTLARLLIDSTSPTASSTLLVDYNGDGVVDSRLSAKKDSIVLPDLTPPSTTVTLMGSKGLNGWYTSSVVANVQATDSESGVAMTYYSIDGTAILGTSTTLTIEGIHTLTYYSIDNAGNSEIATSTIIKIDKTFPEAALTAGTTTQDLVITGFDSLSSTTQDNTASTTTITDQAGNTTTLTFAKTYSGKTLTYAWLESIRYDSSTPILTPTSLLYVWDAKSTLVSQKITIDNQLFVEAVYNKLKNNTRIVVLKKGLPIQTQTVVGLAIVKLTTNKGVLGYGW